MVKDVIMVFGGLHFSFIGMKYKNKLNLTLKVVESQFRDVGGDNLSDSSCRAI